MDAQALTRHLTGKWHRHYGVAPCPVCQPEAKRDQDALTVTDGANGLLLNCKKSSCAFTDILAAAGLTSGDYTPPSAEEIAYREEQAKQEAAKKAARAAQLWNESQPIQGTIAEAYLRGRGITCALGNRLRFHPEAWHAPTAQRHPAMIAAVSHFHGPEKPAVHRTFLKPDGSGKIDVSPKMMLGATKGGCVRLSTGDTLVVAEGIETALSLASGLLADVDGTLGVIASLSSAGMTSLSLPLTPANLLLAPDADSAGVGAACALGNRAAGLGWRVEQMPTLASGDWNDVLIQRQAEVAA